MLYDGVADGLSLLAKKYPLFLVSNCPGWYLEEFFRATGLRDCSPAGTATASRGCLNPECC